MIALFGKTHKQSKCKVLRSTRPHHRLPFSYSGPHSRQRQSAVLLFRLNSTRPPHAPPLELFGSQIVSFDSRRLVGRNIKNPCRRERLTRTPRAFAFRTPSSGLTLAGNTPSR